MPRIFRYDRADSTNERAFEALAAGTARDGDVHVAREQTAGRGRLGRAWESAAGEGLYLSYVHRPEPTEELVPPPAITMGAGLAVFEAVRALGLAGARLDWPNDVVVGDAKLAGILVESRGLDPRAPAFVVGVGVNVAQRAFSAELLRERAVTSFALEGVDSTPDELLEALVPRLVVRLPRDGGELDALAHDYLSAAELIGARVSVRTGTEEHRGLLLGVDLASGSLRLAGEEPQHLELAHVTALARFPET